MRRDHADNSERRRFGWSVGLGLSLILASGVGYRVLANRLVSIEGTVPLAAGTLAALPLNIPGWVGRDVPLDERIIRATDTEDHLNRIYEMDGATKRLAMFLAYGVRLRDLVPHRPEVCYPGAGWTLEESEVVEIPLPDASTLSAQLHRFSRSGLDAERTAVLNYYVVDGNICPDVSALRSQAWRFDRRIRYAAQIQFACRDDQSGSEAKETLREFARLSARPIVSLLTGAVESAESAPSAPKE